MVVFRLHPFTGQRGVWFVVAVVSAIMCLMSYTAGWAADRASVARGGRLFDNWILETKDRPPLKINPEYLYDQPKVDSAEVSWRCVTCHGWDYKGVAEQKTGALSGATGTDLASLTSILRDKNHRYDDKLINRDIADIAAFIADGRIDTALYFDPNSTGGLGDATREVMLYETICANCHGTDGHLIASMESLGDFARAHPQETLHKIFNGHPAEQMPPFRFIDAHRVGDLFAYIRILPAKNLARSIVRGGRLYDHWLKETGGEPPIYRHPAYPKEMPQASSPITNWRCKECHGWDYMGRDGQYGKGPHRTGIKGIRALAGGDPQSVVYLLMDANHRYLSTRWSTGPLKYQDLVDLANFVTRGQIDMDAYIDPRTGAVKGDPRRRKEEFDVLCATCHGGGGKALITGWAIGDFARKNPWEALHKIRNGHPNEEMPALHALDMTFLVDILTYAQTLP